jgi:hypothetical protein
VLASVCRRKSVGLSREMLDAGAAPARFNLELELELDAAPESDADEVALRSESELSPADSSPDESMERLPERMSVRNRANTPSSSDGGGGRDGGGEVTVVEAIDTGVEPCGRRSPVGTAAAAEPLAWLSARTERTAVVLVVVVVVAVAVAVVVGAGGDNESTLSSDVSDAALPPLGRRKCPRRVPAA